MPTYMHFEVARFKALKYIAVYQSSLYIACPSRGRSTAYNVDIGMVAELQGYR